MNTIADISMCQFAECEKSNSCHRFLATPNPEWQSYMKFQNICHAENGYQWYWEEKQSLEKGGDKENV